MKILFTKSFNNDISEIKDKNIIDALKSVIQKFEDVTEISHLTNIKKIKG